MLGSYLAFEESIVSVRPVLLAGAAELAGDLQDQGAGGEGVGGGAGAEQGPGSHPTTAALSLYIGKLQLRLSQRLPLPDALTALCGVRGRTGLRWAQVCPALLLAPRQQPGCC